MTIASFPSTALRANQREVKDAALKAPVLITDSNDARYVLSGEESLSRALRAYVSERVYERRVLDAIERGRADHAAGRAVTGRAEDVIAEMERQRLSHV